MTDKQYKGPADFFPKEEDENGRVKEHFYELRERVMTDEVIKVLLCMAQAAEYSHEMKEAEEGSWGERDVSNRRCRHFCILLGSGIHLNNKTKEGNRFFELLGMPHLVEEEERAA